VALEVVTGDQRATLTWEAPLRGADGVFEYLILVEPGGTRLTIAASGSEEESLSAELLSLTNGVEYSFAVAAISDSGSSEPAIRAGRPTGPPGPPGSLAVRPVASGTLVFGWEPPQDTGGIPLDGYVITSEPEGPSARVDADMTEVRLSGFVQATEYRITVAATNAHGPGEGADTSLITPLPDPAEISVTAADLEDGFTADEDAWVEPGSRLVPEVAITVSTPFRLTSLLRPEVVFGATFLLGDDKVAEFDAIMLNEETLISLLGPETVVSALMSLPDDALLAVPGPAFGVSVIAEVAGAPTRFDLVAARGGNVGVLVIVAELEAAPPVTNAAQIARRLVEQGIAAAPVEAAPSAPSMLWSGSADGGWVTDGIWVTIRTTPGADPDSDPWTIELGGIEQSCATDVRSDGWFLSNCSDAPDRIAIEVLVPRDPSGALEVSGRNGSGASLSASLWLVEERDESFASPNVELVWRHVRSQLIVSHTDIWADDGLVYVGSFGGVVEILDADSGALVSRASTEGDGIVLDVKARGGTMYAATTSGGLLIWDVSDAASPRLAGQYLRRGEFAASDNFFNIHNIALSPRGDIVYALNTSYPQGDLRLIDVSDPARPFEVGRFGVATDGVPTGGVHDINVLEQDGRLIGYLNSVRSGLLILDLTEPANIRLLGSIRWEGTFSHSGWAYELGDAVYFAHTDEGPDQGLTIVDVTDPAAPRVVSSFKTRDGISIHNIEVVDGIGYVSYYVDGLRVLDLRDPEHPREIAHYDTVPREQENSILQGAWGVRVLEGRVFISDRMNGVFAFEVDTEAVD